MKKNKKLILFLVGLISLGLGFASFLIKDYKNIKNLSFDESILNKDYMEDLEEEISAKVDSIDLDLINGSINLEYADRFYYEILKREDSNFKFEYLEIKEDENKFKIVEKHVKVNKDNRGYILNIYIPEDKLIDLNIDSINGNMDIGVDAGKLKIDSVNGNIVLSGESSYDLEIDSVNAKVDLDFNDYNASVKGDVVNGSIYFLGERVNPTFNSTHLLETVGSGKDNINISIINGKINID